MLRNNFSPSDTDAAIALGVNVGATAIEVYPQELYDAILNPWALFLAQIAPNPSAPTDGPIPLNYTPINEGGTYYLRVLLEALYTNGFRTLRDINANYYSISKIYYSGNNPLLNSIVYYDADAKRITPCTNLQNLAGQPPNISQINLWVNANAPGGPMVVIPPPIFQMAENYLYDVSSPV
jgi:hypothetical protein